MDLVVDLLPAVVAHAAVGVLLCVSTWSLGFAVLGALGRVEREDVVLAYPLGLVALITLAAIALLHPAGAVTAGILLSLSVVALARARSALRWLADAGRGAALATGFGFVYAAVLGIHERGPTAEHGSHAFGDVTFYAAKLVAARESLFPFRDLTALDVEHTFLESGASILGGAVASVGPVDPFLFHASTLPVFMLASVAVGAHVVRRDVAPGIGIVLAVLLVATLAYPSWVAESPPVALALPLAPPVYRLAFGRSPSPIVFVAVGAAVVAALLMTKTLAVVAVAVVLAPAAVVLLRRVGTAARVMIGAAVAGLGALAGAVLSTGEWVPSLLGIEFAPLDAFRVARDQLGETRTQGLAPALELAGRALLLLSLIVARERLLAASLGAGLTVSWLVSGHSFDITIAFVLIVVALRLAAIGAAPRLVAVAGIALFLGAWFRDIAQLPTSLVLALLLLAAFLVTVAPSTRTAAIGIAAVAAGAGFALSGHALVGAVAAAAIAAALAVSRLPRAAITAATILVLAVSGAAVARAERAGTIGLGAYDDSILTTDYRRVWRLVDERVPRSALVFTTHTGSRPTPEHGWNYYPAVAGRQVYLAGWYDSVLRVDEKGLARRLALNRDLFSGRIAPSDIVEASRFDGFYAVAWKIEGRPRTFDELAATQSYVLYRLPAFRVDPVLINYYDCQTHLRCRRLDRPRILGRR